MSKPPSGLESKKFYFIFQIKLFYSNSFFFFFMVFISLLIDFFLWEFSDDVDACFRDVYSVWDKGDEVFKKVGRDLDPD